MGIFDNASSVSIGGKEVQSMKLASNNAVLYEKVSDNYLLTLSSNKDILSYYDSESATLTATLTNNNIGVSGKTVIFSGGMFSVTDTVSSRVNYDMYIGTEYTAKVTGSNSSAIVIGHEEDEYYLIIYSNYVVVQTDDGPIYDGRINGSEFTVTQNSVSTANDSLDISEYNIDVSNFVGAYNGTYSINTNAIGVITNNNGVATCTYSSQGVGDVTITAECMNLTETYSIEDIYLFRSQEYSHTLEAGGNTLNKLMDETTSLDLPEKFELTFEYKSTGATSSAEHRVYFMPRSLFVANTQPSTAMMVGNIACGNSAHVGVRRDGSKTKNSSQSFSCNTFHTFKITRPYVQSYSTSVFFYYDGSYIDYWSLPLAYNYHDWCLCFHMWNAGTVTIRNIKLKAL